MKITDSIAQLMFEDFEQQRLVRLQEWDEKFPDSWDAIADLNGGALLKAALLDEKWLLSAYLLRNPNIRKKELQIASVSQHENIFCPLLLQCHVQDLPASKLKLLNELQDLVAL
ncbi:MAG: hypothetical protein CL840_04060 [Crocinitomicaceae bacterium]|nr:hypothetical protein [Crocinitomicaceae bacterium]|tara:strand:+ start:9991 stop:10332 length:342 start_codon:yes stop_codon:yes gene_type:complete